MHAMHLKTNSPALGGGWGSGGGEGYTVKKKEKKLSQFKSLRQPASADF